MNGVIFGASIEEVKSMGVQGIVDVSEMKGKQLEGKQFDFFARRT